VIVAGGSDDEVESESVSVSVNDLTVGTCMPADAEFAEVSIVLETVECRGPHRYEVYADTRISTSQPYDEDNVANLATQKYITAFHERYDVRYLESAFEVWPFYPLEQGWNLGDRGVICVADSGISIDDPITSESAGRPMGDDRLMSLWGVKAGECYRGDATVGLVSLVSYTTAHDWEVTAVIDVDDYRGDDALLEIAQTDCRDIADQLGTDRPEGTICIWDGYSTAEIAHDLYGFSRIMCLVEKLL
jgi:hypothetical protein